MYIVRTSMALRVGKPSLTAMHLLMSDFDDRDRAHQTNDLIARMTWLTPYC